MTNYERPDFDISQIVYLADKNDLTITDGVVYRVIGYDFLHNLYQLSKVYDGGDPITAAPGEIVANVFEVFKLKTYLDTPNDLFNRVEGLPAFANRETALDRARELGGQINGFFVICTPAMYTRPTVFGIGQVICENDGGLIGSLDRSAPLGS